MQKKDNVEQNNAVLRQPTTQESGAKAAPEDESELESEHLSASDDTQQQLNAVIQREEVAWTNKTAACNQKSKFLL